MTGEIEAHITDPTRRGDSNPLQERHLEAPRAPAKDLFQMGQTEGFADMGLDVVTNPANPLVVVVRGDGLDYL